MKRHSSIRRRAARAIWDAMPLRGFDATQVDFTLQRMFRFGDRFSLKWSADFFNIFNHPNFGAPINYMSSPQFGYSTQTLNSWLGSGGQGGGLNPPSWVEHPSHPGGTQDGRSGGSFAGPALAA